MFGISIVVRFFLQSAPGVTEVSTDEDVLNEIRAVEVRFDKSQQEHELHHDFSQDLWNRCPKISLALIQGERQVLLVGCRKFLNVITQRKHIG